MNAPFYQLMHPDGGVLKFQIAKGFVEFACNWPFDVNTNEWINLSNRFSLNAYRKNIKRLSRTRATCIRGIRSGNMHLRKLSDNIIELSVVGEGKPTIEQLNFRLSACAKDLMPGINGRS